MLREPADASLTICRRQGGSLGQFASIAVLDVLDLRSEQEPRPGHIFQYSLVLVRRRSVRQAQTLFCILVKLAGVHCLPPLDISQLLSSRYLKVSTVLRKYGHIQPQRRENHSLASISVARRASLAAGRRRRASALPRRILMGEAPGCPSWAGMRSRAISSLSFSRLFCETPFLRAMRSTRQNHLLAPIKTAVVPF